MPGPKSSLEASFAKQVLTLGLARGLVRDFVFHPTRRWELDFAWPNLKVYVSIEGGIGRSSHRGISIQYQQVRSVTGQLVKVPVGQRDGFAEDCIKHSEAAIMGWLGIRVTGSMVASGEAARLLTRAMAARRH